MTEADLELAKLHCRELGDYKLSDKLTSEKLYNQLTERLYDCAREYRQMVFYCEARYTAKFEKFYGRLEYNK